MATARLTPTTYYLSNSTYLSVANPANLYANTDSTEYATVKNSQNGTSSYYIYLRGFDFSSIPDGAEVTGFTVKFKAYESGISTSSSYRPYLCNGTSTLTGSCSTVGTSANVLTFTGVSAAWDTIKGYGSNFGIRINCRRASRNTTGYMYIYGAEILVEYTLGTKYTVTTSCTGGTVEPSGTTEVDEGGSLTVCSYPDDGMSLSSFTVNGQAVTPETREVSAMENGVALFHLDGSTTDALGNASMSSTGTMNTTSPKFGSGCVYLDGSSYITVSLPSDQSPMTLEMWFNVTKANASGSYPTLFSSTSTTSAGGTYMHIDDGSYSTSCVCRSNASGSSTNTGGYGSTVISRNAWHHFAYCRNGSSHYFFIDGVLQYTVTQSSPNSMATLYIGGLRGNGSMVSGCYMTGYIDEVVVSSVCKWTAGFVAPTSAYSAETRTAHAYTLSDVRFDTTVSVSYTAQSGGVYLKVSESWAMASGAYIKSGGAWRSVGLADAADALESAANLRSAF